MFNKKLSQQLDSDRVLKNLANSKKVFENLFKNFGREIFFVKLIFEMFWIFYILHFSEN